MDERVKLNNENSLFVENSKLKRQRDDALASLSSTKTTLASVEKSRNDLEKAKNEVLQRVEKAEKDKELASGHILKLTMAKRKEFSDLAMLVDLEAFENAINQVIALNPGFSLRTADTNVNYVCLTVTWLSL